MYTTQQKEATNTSIGFSDTSFIDSDDSFYYLGDLLLELSLGKVGSAGVNDINDLKRETNNEETLATYFEQNS